MSTNTSSFIISGKVKNRSDNQPIPNLRIEVWDKDFIHHDLLGKAHTDELGLFRVSFNENEFKDLFFEKYPDVFFKVYEGNKLLLNTLYEVSCNLRPGIHPVTIFVNHQDDGNNQEEVLSGPLILPETIFQFKQLISRTLSELGPQHPPEALSQLNIPFSGVPNLMDLSLGVLTGDPTQMKRLRETLWSFGGKAIPSHIALKIFQLHDGNTFIGNKGNQKRRVKLEDIGSVHFSANQSSTPQLVDMNRLEKVMLAAAYSARDVKELATLTGSIELALRGINEMNTLFNLAMSNAAPMDIASAFDTAVRVSGFSSWPPFDGFTPGEGGFPFPGQGPGFGVPWFEWPLPIPGGSNFPTPQVPQPRLPEFDPGQIEHFEECMLTNIIPELHYRGIGFREFIFQGTTNYVIENVTPQHVCPGEIVTLTGTNFDGVTFVRYKNNHGRTVDTAPLTASSTRITFRLSEDAVSGPVWLYIPHTIRLCLTEQTLAVSGVHGELVVGRPHIISFEAVYGGCMELGQEATVRWRVSPANVRVQLSYALGSLSHVNLTPGMPLDAIGSLNFTPPSLGLYTLTLIAENEIAPGDCERSIQSIQFEVKEPAAEAFEIVGVEVTQAIQYFDVNDPAAATNNSIPLYADMDTVLRVFVRSSAVSPPMITGTMEFNGDMYPPINGSPPGSTPIIPVPTVPDRAMTDHSLNFLIPAAYASGTGQVAKLRLFATTDTCHPVIEFWEQPLTWENKIPLPVTIRIVANSDGTQMTRFASRLFIWRTFFRIPSPKTAISLHPGVHQIREGTTEDNYCRDGGFYQLALSIAYEHNDNEGYPPASHSSSWIGLVTPTDCTPDGMMAWPSTSTCLSVQNEETAAHEILHTVGMGHTVTGNGEGCWEGPSFTGGDTQPVPCHRLPGRPDGVLDEIIFDIENNEVISGAVDLMSYARGDGWLSPEHWIESRRMINTRY